MHTFTFIGAQVLSRKKTFQVTAKIEQTQDETNKYYYPDIQILVMCCFRKYLSLKTSIP